MVAREANWAAISDFLTLSYIPGRQTAFNGVEQVLPGHRLIIDGGVKYQQWWQPPSYKESEKVLGIDNEQKIHECLQQAVNCRLVSDVPIGVFSSGGVDLALILSLIARSGFPDNFTAYTVGFEEQDFDETAAAKELAKSFSIRHESIHMRPEDFSRIFADAVYKSDNLLANPAMFANYLLSEKASQHVKAVLHGGADELFFGYPTYKADILAEYLSTISSLSAQQRCGSERLPASFSKLGFKYKAVKFLQGLHMSPEKRHYWWRTIFTEQEKDLLLSSKVDRNDSFKTYEQAFSKFSGDDFLEACVCDREVWWAAMGLYQGDAMSMANSLELRMPFMDKALIESMANIPREESSVALKLKSCLKKCVGATCQPTFLIGSRAASTCLWPSGLPDLYKVLSTSNYRQIIFAIFRN